MGLHVDLDQLSFYGQAFYFKPGTCEELLFVDRVTKGRNVYEILPISCVNVLCNNIVVRVTVML